MIAKRFAVTLGCVMLPMLATPVMAESDAVLAKWGDIAVTQDDMRRYLNFYLPEEDHAKALESQFTQYVGNIIMMRELARRAEQQDIGPDAKQLAWQQQYQAVVWQAKAYQEQSVTKANTQVDWDARAQEVYIAEPERFTSADKIDAAHILVQVKDRTDDEARELIESIRERAVAGESFTQLAKEYSEDTGSSSAGGKLGKFEARQMAPEFAEAAFALAKPGDLSGVVKTQFGYHIIKLNKKIPGTKRAFKQVKTKLIEQLKQEYSKGTVNTMLSELRQEVFSQPLNTEAANKLRAEYGLKPLPDADLKAADQ